jgi:hypothetical protein
MNIDMNSSMDKMCSLEEIQEYYDELVKSYHKPISDIPLRPKIIILDNQEIDIHLNNRLKYNQEDLLVFNTIDDFLDYYTFDSPIDANENLNFVGNVIHDYNPSHKYISLWKYWASFHNITHEDDYFEYYWYKMMI